MMHPRTVLFVAVATFLLGVAAGTFFVAPLLHLEKRDQVAVRQRPAPAPAAAADPYAQAVDEGNRAMDGGQFQQAIAAYDRALAIKFDANVATDRGICFRELGERDRALTAFEFVTMRDPSHWQAQFNKAVVLTEAKRYAEARKLTDTLLREHPEAPEVRQLDAALKSAMAQSR